MPVIPLPEEAQIAEVRATKPSLWERTSLILALILAGAAILLFWRLGAYGLIDVDEGRYAEVPREMLLSGDWLTPRLNFIKFFDKPPLLYWAIAASYRVFGVTEWAARLVPTLAALAGIGAAYALGRRMFGPRAGALSALILLTSLMWTVMARVVLTDMVVSSLVFCALAAWWLAISDDSSRRRTGFLALFWGSLGLGMLAKGPVAPVLCGGAIFGYLLVCRRWRDLQKMGWSWGVPLFVALAAPWYFAVAARHPEFNHAFWYEQNFGRFTGTIAKVDHSQGPLFLLQFVPLTIFPWSVFALPALLALCQSRWPARADERRAALFLGCAVAFVILFFSASESKLVTYILPVVPPLAILMAAYFDRIWDAPVERGWLLPLCVGALAFALIIGGVVAGSRAAEISGALQVGAASVFAAALSLAIWGWALALALWKRSAGALFGATAGGFALCFAVGMTLVSQVARGLTTEPLIAQIRPGIGPRTEILAIGFSQSLPFYTGKRMRVLGTPDELAPAKARLSEAQKARWFFQIAPDLRRLMLTSTPTYCVIRRNKFLGYQERAALALAGTQGRVFEVASNDRFVILANAAAARLTPQPAGASEFDDLRRQMQNLDARGRDLVLQKGKLD